MKFVWAAMIAGLALWGQEWPQWRGAARDGVVAGFARTSWPESLTRRWSVEIGEGHSSPVVSGGRVYVFTREKGEEVVRALDAATGKPLWRQAYPAPYRMNPAATHHGEGPKSTPVLAGGRLCTLGISSILSCWDAASGKLIWRKEFSKEYRATSPWYGTAMSPGVFDGMLIAHVGGQDNGALTAFDAATGAVRWSWKGDGPGYASPVAAEFGGIRQIVTETQNNVVGVALADGKLLWQIPLKTSWDQNAVTPVILGDTVIYGGLDRPLRAIRPLRRGESWKIETVWETQEAGSYMNTLVARGDRLYGLHSRNKGQYYVLNAKSGKVLAKSAPRQGDNAAMVLAGDSVVALNNSAELSVVRAGGDAWQVTRTYKVADRETWAHPVVLSGGILVKDLNSLAYWSFQ